jgi:hypothetical protein
MRGDKRTVDAAHREVDGDPVIGVLNLRDERVGPGDAGSAAGRSGTESATTTTPSRTATKRRPRRSADNLVRFEIEGPGKIAAVDNGNAASVESFQASERKAFSGLALLVLRTRPGTPGTIRVRARSEGLAAGEALLAAE